MFRPLLPQKRKSTENDSDAPNKQHKVDRAPLGTSTNTPHGSGPKPTNVAASNSATYWMVQWRKPQAKKHKTWDGDAVMTVRGSKAWLQDMEGKSVGSGTISGQVQVGDEFTVGGKEVEVDCAISAKDYNSGMCFGSVAGGALANDELKKPAPAAAYKPPTVSYTKPVSHALSKPKPPPAKVPVAAPSLERTVREENEDVARYFMANWRKPQSKMHKTWDGDAFLVVTGDKCIMQDASGKIMANASWKPDWLVGDELHLGGKEVKIDASITAAEFQSYTTGIPMAVPDPEPERVSSVAAKSFYGPAQVGGAQRPAPKPKIYEPLYDANAEDAFVLPRPSPSHIAKYNKGNKPVMDVVVDPLLASRLRPHQKEGVTFLYEAVMGMRRHEGCGAILADEMGLGKTLQTIALIWTLLKQSPYGGQSISKAMIVCPVSLVNNWRSEFHKWLGRDRLEIFMGDKDKSHIKQFLNSRRHQVLIIGYEKLRTVINDLAYCIPPIQLIVCDEGHRLKSANNKTSKMFDALKTQRRVILSGTPIQNDLGEFWAMADFCNPGLLDDYNTFKRLFEQPIVKSRTPGCREKDRELGEARSEQLAEVSKSFVLRRTAEILSSYLPPKHEYVVFIRPTDLQLSLFASILDNERINRLVRGSMAQSLELINTLGKVCTNPILLKNAKTTGKEQTPEVKEMLKLLPSSLQQDDVSVSGKMIALANLLDTVKKTTEEKVVVVSQFTQTLNLVEAFCQKKRYSFHRLDGSTPQGKRMDLVNAFNKSSQTSSFLFLLSAKAGGVGLNLVAASRLVLLDSSWNPSHDLQAMARIHRDGQKRPVHIYRFLTTGTIDEKIYQRQITKMGLSDSLMASNVEEKSKGDSFSPEELRDLFRIHPNTGSHTHDLLACTCSASLTSPAEQATAEEHMSDDDEEIEDLGKKGWMLASQINEEQLNKIKAPKKRKAELAALDEWIHIDCMTSSGREDIQDPLLRAVVSKPYPARASISTDADSSGSGSRLSKILDAIDIENIPNKADGDEEEDAGLDMSSVAGGSITFLFTKSSL